MPIKGEKVDSNEVLTFDGQPADGETVMVWGRMYVFRKPKKIETDLIPDVENEVVVGADLKATIANLHAAVHGVDGAGTRYARSTRPHAKLGSRKVVATHTSLIFGPEADKAEAVQKKKEATAEKEARDFAKEAKADAKAIAEGAKTAAERDADLGHPGPNPYPNPGPNPNPPIEPEPKPDPNRS